MSTSSPATNRVLAAGAVLTILMAVAGIAWLAWPTPGPAHQVSERHPLLPEKDLVVHAGPVARTPPPKDGRSVVLVVASELPTRMLEPYGAGWGRTPFFGELGRQGAVFTGVTQPDPLEAQAAAEWLAGGTASLVPRDAGESRLPPEATTLAERFQAAGWQTFGIAAHPDLHADEGFGQGYDVYRNPQPGGLELRSRLQAPRAVEIGHRMLQGHLRESRDQPFLLVVNLVDAIPPHRNPPELVRRLAGDHPDEDRQFMAQVHRMDEATRHLVEGIESMGPRRAQDLLVAVLTVSAQSAPGLVLMGPGVGSKTVEDPVSLGEVPETLLQLAGAVPLGAGGGTALGELAGG